MGSHPSVPWREDHVRAIDRGSSTTLVTVRQPAEPGRSARSDSGHRPCAWMSEAPSHDGLGGTASREAGCARLPANWTGGMPVAVKTRGIRHVHLMVMDHDRSVRFYREVFGMDVGFRD